MVKFSLSGKILPALVVLCALSVFFSTDGDFLHKLLIIFIYSIILGGSGFIGLKLSSKINFPDLWEEKIPIKNKVIFPIIYGIIIGIIFIVIQMIIRKIFLLESFGSNYSYLFIFGNIYSSITDEIIWRLFFTSFLIWFISKIIFKSKYFNVIFWIVAILITITSSFFTLYSSRGFISFTKISTTYKIDMLLRCSLLSMFCIYSFRKYGIISSIIIHFTSFTSWQLFEIFIH